MGWRADIAYEKEEREEWRRYMAAQPLWRRIYICVQRNLIFILLAMIVFGPLLASLIRGIF